MVQTVPLRINSVSAQKRANTRTTTWIYLGVVGVGLLIGLAGFGALADPFALALALLVCGGATILARPIMGVYLTVFFSVLGDKVTMLGYPFNANFSSKESWLFLSNALTFTPVEVFLGLTAVSWLAHVASARRWHSLGRPVQWPVLVFGGFVGLGLVYGIGFQGGDLTVAVWEIRPLLYLAGMYVLASNLLTRRTHYVTLAWVVVLAISVQNFFAIRYYQTASIGQRELLQGLTEHPASLLYAWVFLLALAVCILRGCSGWARLLMIAAAIPTGYVFVLSERRAAVVAFAAGLIVFAFVLFFRRRRAFFVFVPVVVVLATAYSVAFWNAPGDGVGFGARAVKSVIAPNEVSARDSSSDVYRVIENYNLVYTIRAAPLTGVGFGKPFLQPAPLPDISSFVFYQYVPHNSVLWIWLNTGYFGFVALLFLIASALRAGTRASLQLPSGDALAVTVGALGFIVMFFVFAYVDIAWDARSCLFLAVCLATCANMLKVAATGDEGGKNGRSLFRQSRP